MNKSLQKILALSALVLGFGVGASALADDKVCTTCHDASWDKPILSIYQTRHGVKTDSRTPGCQSCHGTSDSHLKSPSNSPDVVFTKKTKNTAEQRNDTCLACHKAGKRAHWDGSQHANQDLACASCHTVHAPSDKVMSKATQPEVCYTCHKTERAQSKRVSTHPIEAGKVACSDCHNPHGTTGPKLLVKDGVNATCYTCHAEKRGPFLWEHAPVADDCSNCHAVHGSSTAPLLKARLPFLCQQCHQDHGASLKSGASVVNGPGGLLGSTVTPTTATALGKSPSVQGTGRMCLNCHVMVHGSNAPSGGFFNR